MTTRIDDPVLRAALVADIRRRANAWRDQGVRAWTDDEQRGCLLRAAVLEQLARDLEDAAIGKVAETA